jgi:Uri superfamily endonuclease
MKEKQQKRITRHINEQDQKEVWQVGHPNTYSHTKV